MKINRVIYEFEKWLAILLLLIMFILTFGQFVARYFFNTGYAWVPEVVVLACINLALVAASTGVKSGVHISVDVIVKLFPIKFQNYSYIFANLCGVILYLFMCYLTGKFVLFFKHSGHISITTEIPMWIFIVYIPVAFFMMAFHYLEILLDEFLKRKRKIVDSSKGRI